MILSEPNQLVLKKVYWFWARNDQIVKVDSILIRWSLSLRDKPSMLIEV